MISVGDDAPGESMLAAAPGQAVAFRDMLHIDATAYRVVHGEADRLPSLVVDEYGDYLVVQTLSQGMDRRLPELTQALRRNAGAEGHSRPERSEDQRRSRDSSRP